MVPASGRRFIGRSDMIENAINKAWRQD